VSLQDKKAMMTTSHAFFTYAFAPAGPAVARAVIGSVLPDLPFWIMPPAYALWRGRWAGALVATKDGLISGTLLRAGHSLVVWAFAAALVAGLAPDWMPLIWGWLGHVASDFVTHHGEPHAHFYPLSDWRYASPVSYYEWDHHAAYFMAGEGLLAGLILTGWARHESLLTTAGWLIHQPWLWAAGAVVAVVLWRWHDRREDADVVMAVPPGSADRRPDAQPDYQPVGREP
jgi:hypothetical protein